MQQRQIRRSFTVRQPPVCWVPALHWMDEAIHDAYGDKRAWLVVSEADGHREHGDDGFGCEIRGGPQ